MVPPQPLHPRLARHTEIQLTILTILPKLLQRRDLPLRIINPRHLNALRTRVDLVVVHRNELDRAVRRREHRVRQVRGLRDMVHAEVEPDDDVGLGDVVAVEEGGEIDHGVVRVLGVVRVGGAGLGVFLFGDEEVVGGPVGGVVEVGGILDGEVDGAGGGADLVAAGFAVGVGGVEVDDFVLGRGVGSVVDGGGIFGGDEFADEFHGVAGLAVGPGVGDGGGCVGDGFHGVGGAEDVEVDFEVEDVVVHGAGEGVVDVVAVVLVLGEVGGLDVAAGFDVDFHGAVDVELVGEHVVVVADSADVADCEDDVFGGAGVSGVCVVLDRVTWVVLEETQTVDMGVCRFFHVEGVVEIGCVCWTVVSFDELERIRTEAVVRIEVARP